MTNYEKMLSVETVTHYAYLLSKTMDCERCPAKQICDNTKNFDFIDSDCMLIIKQWLEQEAE